MELGYSSKITLAADTLNCAISKCEGISAAYIIGSHAQERADTDTSQSDIDILIIKNQRFNLEEAKKFNHGFFENEVVNFPFQHIICDKCKFVPRTFQKLHFSILTEDEINEMCAEKDYLLYSWLKNYILVYGEDFFSKMMFTPSVNVLIDGTESISTMKEDLVDLVMLRDIYDSKYEYTKSINYHKKNIHRIIDDYNIDLLIPNINTKNIHEKDFFKEIEVLIALYDEILKWALDKKKN